MPHVTLDPGIVETVRMRLLRMYQRERWTWRDMAKRIGCADRTLYLFVERERESTGLCLSIMKAYPEIAADILIERDGVFYLRV